VAGRGSRRAPSLRRAIYVCAGLVAAASIAIATLPGGGSPQQARTGPSAQERAFAGAYRDAATVFARRDAALQQRAAAAAAAGPDRLIALYEDIRASTERAREELSTVAVPPSVRTDVERMRAALAARSDALKTLIAPAQGADVARAVQDLSATTQLLQSIDHSITARLGA
jgi:hypothetical protein